jgi:hypothetical protein
MTGIDKGPSLDNQQSSEEITLDDYLNSELKLQSEIDKKLQDPSLQDIAREELEEIKARFQESLNKASDSTSQ